MSLGLLFEARIDGVVAARERLAGTPASSRADHVPGPQPPSAMAAWPGPR
jgi:hypothetical protein